MPSLDIFRASEMAGKVKAFTAKPGDTEFDLWDPYGGRGELPSSTDCPLSSAGASWYISQCCTLSGLVGFQLPGTSRLNRACASPGPLPLLSWSWVR